jgi:hypothetical protein
MLSDRVVIKYRLARSYRGPLNVKQRFDRILLSLPEFSIGPSQKYSSMKSMRVRWCGIAGLKDSQATGRLCHAIDGSFSQAQSSQ